MRDAAFDDSLFSREVQRRLQKRGRDAETASVSPTGETRRDQELERIIQMLEKNIRSYWAILDTVSQEGNHENVTRRSDDS